MEVTQTPKIESFSVKHLSVPEGFVYMRKYNFSESNLLVDLNIFWKDLIPHVYDSPNGNFAIPPTGFYTFDSVETWFYTQDKQGYVSVYFRSLKEYNKLIQIIEQKSQDRIKKITNPVYRYSSQCGWRMVDTYSTKDAEKDLFGYDHYVSTISKDFDNHIKYNDFLQSLGEMRSINYLLYGPPGTGKTSLIRAIASLKGCAVFLVSSSEVTVKSIKNVLTPNVSIETPCKLKLLLFEDFDRFLTVDGVSNIMSQILNTLDGFDDKGDTIRFFTANNKQAIFEVDALINRMSSKFEFYYPDANIFKSKLERFLTFYESSQIDTEKVNKLVELVCSKGITVRPFVNYVVRYLFDPNPLDVMIAHIDELN